MSFHTILCPCCGYVHEVPEHYFEGRDSRLLKCAQCEHVWRCLTASLSRLAAPKEHPPPESSPILDEFKTVSPLSLSPQLREAHFFHKTSVMSSLPFKGASHKKTWLRRWEGWFLLLAVGSGMGVFFSEVAVPWEAFDVQKKIKAAQGIFYEGIDMIADKLIPHRFLTPPVTLSVLTSNLSLKGNASTLTVKGEVVNHSEKEQYIPCIMVQLMDTCEEGNGELCLRHTFRYTPDPLPLKPKERRIFEASDLALKDTLPTTVILSFEDK